MRLIATRKSEQNESVLDPWTVVHSASGLAAGRVRVPSGWSLGAAVGYEVAEQVLERLEVGQEMFSTSGPESPSNAILDVPVLAVGVSLGELRNRTGQTAGGDG